MNNYWNILIGAILLSVLTSCTKEEVIKLELDVEMKGQVSLYSQYGEKLDPTDEVSIILDNSEKQYVFHTDAEGYYVASGLKTGIYNVTIAAEGFVTEKYESVQLLGGKEPDYYNYYLTRPATAKVANLHLKKNQQGRLIVAGNWSDSNYMPGYSNSYKFVIFTHNTDEISVTNYTSYIGYSFWDNLPQDGYFEVELRIDLPEEDPLYFILCAAPHSNSLKGLGQPSNIAVYHE